jgi:hypothetical protein
MGESMSELNLSVAGPVLRILLLGDGLDASAIDRKHIVDRAADASEALPDLPDVLVAAGHSVGPELLAWLAAPLRADLPIVLVTDEGEADAAGPLLGHNVIAFLAPEDGPDALAGTLVALENRVGRKTERSPGSAIRSAGSPATASRWSGGSRRCVARRNG